MCCVGVLARCVVPDCWSWMVTSILVSAGVGVDTATSTCVVPSPAPGRGDMLKLLLLELWPVGMCLAGTGVLGGVVFGLLMDDRILRYGSRVRSLRNLAG